MTDQPHDPKLDRPIEEIMKTTVHPDVEKLRKYTSPWSGGTAPYDGPGVFENALDVDEDSVFTVAMERTGNIGKNIKDDDHTPIISWLDGFITGMRFMRTAMEPHIIPGDGQHRG